MIKFSLISPSGVIAKSDCYAVTLPSASGQITILPHHAPIYTLVEHGEVVVKTGSREESFAVGTGFAKITGSDVSVMVDFGINADDIQEEQVKAAQERAAQLLQQQTDKTDLVKAQAELLKATLQLKLTAKKRKTRS